MSFRKEKKLRLTLSDAAQLKSLLRSRGMTDLYNPRQVQSVYFDTPSLSMFYESEEGILPRKKIRVRWYNNDLDAQLEHKVSSHEGRFKTTQPFTAALSESNLSSTKLYDSLYGTIVPTLKVSYSRRYFNYHRMRITFDFQIRYSYIKDGGKRDYLDPEVVVEIKVPMTCGDDYIERFFPMSTSRFSKYSRGMLMSQEQLSHI
jgi:hypothetical protein